MRVYLLTVEDPLYTHFILDPLLASGTIELGGVTILQPRTGRGRYLSSIITLGIRRCLIAGAAQFAPQLISTSVATLLRRHRIPLRLTAKASNVNAPSHVARLHATQCSVMVALNCPQIISAPVLDTFADGVLNVHFGMLPQYRGIMPAYHALMNGEPSFGVTIHFMDSRIDNGPIAAQRAVPILPRDTLPHLYEKGFKAAGTMLIDVLGDIANGTGTRALNDASAATYFSQPTASSLARYAALAFRRRIAPTASSLPLC